jgi:predicted dehydrogenase
MKKKNIVLIAGAGNIAFYYFLAINSLNLPITIYVYDINKNSLDIFKKKIISIKIKPHINIYFINKLEKKRFRSNRVDLAIISSVAKNRYLLIIKIYSILKVKNLIIEKIVEQSSYKLKVLKNFFLRKKNIYVSHGRRCSNFYKYIKKINLKKIIFFAQGDNWGLACNGMHMLDTILWLTNDKIKFVRTDKLKKWFNAKRHGFEEVDGKISFYFRKGSELHLSCDKDLKEKIEFFSESDHWQIIGHETILLKNKKKVLKKNKITLSNIMSIEINKILLNKRSNLPQFTQVYKNYDIYIRSFLKHRNKFFNKKAKNLPIT